MFNTLPKDQWAVQRQLENLSHVLKIQTRLRAKGSWKISVWWRKWSGYDGFWWFGINRGKGRFNGHNGFGGLSIRGSEAQSGHFSVRCHNVNAASFGKKRMYSYDPSRCETRNSTNDCIYWFKSLLSSGIFWQYLKTNRMKPIEIEHWKELIFEVSQCSAHLNWGHHLSSWTCGNPGLNPWFH